MIRLKRALSQRRTFFSLLGAFSLLLAVAYGVNVAFLCNQAFRSEDLERSLLVNALTESIADLTQLLEHMREDTAVLLTMPGLDTFAATGEISPEDARFFATYAQSRYAIDGVFYYHTQRQALFGYDGEARAATGAAQAREILALSRAGFDALLAADGFVLTDEGDDSRLILSNRVAGDVVCLRLVPRHLLHQLLPASAQDVVDSLSAGWALTMTDSAGQTLQAGSGVPGDGAHTYALPGDGLRFTFSIADTAGQIVLKTVRQTILPYGGILLVVGGLLIWLLLTRVYRPLQNTIGLLPDQQAGGEEGSEHDRIQSAIRALVAESSTQRDALTAQQTLLNAQRTLLRQSFLQRLFSGALIDGGEVALLQSRYGMESRFERYAVLLVWAEGIDFEPVDWAALCTPGAFELFFVDSIADAALLMMSLAPGADERAAVERVACGFHAAVGAAPRVCCSAIHTDASEANTAWLEALLVNERGLTRSRQSGAFFYAALAAKDIPNASWLVPMEQQLMQLAISGRDGKFSDLLAQYLRRISPFSLRMQKVLTVSLFTRIVSLDAAAKENAALLREPELLALLSSGLSADAFHAMAMDLGLRALPPRDADPQSLRFEKIRQYVNQHIREEALSAAAVADHFGISQSSLTREFQKNTGYGFASYIHIQRIHLAKTLLTDSGDTIKEIAAKVGYANSLALTRAFHKYEGTTPGSYRTDQSKR